MNLKNVFLLSILSAFCACTNTQRNQSDLLDQPDLPIDPDQSRIYLVGENHASKQDQERGDKMREDGEKGQYYVCLEGQAFDEEKSKLENYKDSESRVFGIDDHFLMVVPMAAKHYVTMQRGLGNSGRRGGSLTNTKLDFLITFINNKYAADAWSSVDRPFEDARQEDLAVKIDDVISRREEDLPILRQGIPHLIRETNLIKVYKSVADRKYNRAFLDVSETYARTVGKLMKKEYRDRGWSLDTFYDAIDNPSSMERQEAVTMKIAVEYRNISMAPWIAKLHKNANTEGKDLKVIIGKRHVPDLKNRLRKLVNAEIVVEGM